MAYCNEFYVSGHDAEEYFAVLDNKGEKALLDYLLAHVIYFESMDYSAESPWGTSDTVYKYSYIFNDIKETYILSYNMGLQYIGVARIVTDPEEIADYVN